MTINRALELADSYSETCQKGGKLTEETWALRTLAAAYRNASAINEKHRKSEYTKHVADMIESIKAAFINGDFQSAMDAVELFQDIMANRTESYMMQTHKALQEK